MALRVFPPNNVTQPRKSSLKKPRPADTSHNELKGVAFQVNTARVSAAVVQNGDQHVKHSLFCDHSTAASDSSKLSPLKRRQRASDRSSAASVSTLIRCDSPQEDEDDALAPLPENSSFGSTSTQVRLSPGVDRPSIPLSLSTEVLPGGGIAVSPGGDRLSPLPERDRFVPASPPKPEYPAAARSLRSTSPTLVQGESPASTAPPYSPPQLSRQRSIFPLWDPTKALGEQQYYPSTRSTTPKIAPEKISKTASHVDRKRVLPPLDLQQVEPMATVVVGYEHIPMANSTDLIEVWNASCGKHPASVRKSLFRLIQPRGKGTSLGIGVSEESVVWSMKKEEIPTSDESAEPLDQLVISKSAPGNPNLTKVASLALPKFSRSDDHKEDNVVGVFPHMAAIHAIESAATSAAATAIAKGDPTAKSPEAARLAQNAIADARRRHQALLFRTDRQRESLGAVTATYQLQHPNLGVFAITVTKSEAGRYSRDPRAKISLHHPSATPAAILAETLVLAFLDSARDACVLDVPALLALEASYMIDTVICALLGVAVIENDALIKETMTFAAPPKSPLSLPKSGSTTNASINASKESQRASGLFKRKKKQQQKKKKEEIELPVLTKGALALLGMSFKVAVWTLELGVKATAGVIITTSHIVQKA